MRGLVSVETSGISIATVQLDEVWLHDLEEHLLCMSCASARPSLCTCLNVQCVSDEVEASAMDEHV